MFGNNNELVAEVANYIGKSTYDQKIIDIMKEIDRKDFLPKKTKALAYNNEAVAIGYRGTCSQPSLVAQMISFLQLKEDSKILEIGAGCGYNAAIMSKLVPKGEVYSLEYYSKLAEFATTNLQDYDNVTVIKGDGSLGYKEQAPYDKIIFTAGVNKDSFNERLLLKQLDYEGMMLYPESTTQELYFYEKVGREVTLSTGGNVVFVPLRGKNS